VGVCAEIREACAAVAAAATHVRVDEARLAVLADELAAGSLEPAGDDPARRLQGSPETTLAYIFTLDAVNFGSGWFPRLHKRPGMSGYFTVATALEERFAAGGAWSAQDLCALDARILTRVLGQDPDDAEVAELMALYARALNDLGRFLLDGYAGRFAGLVEEAAGSAEALVEILARMPFFDDVSVWRGRRVPLYKRAQIAASDLALAFGGEGWGSFRDLDRLTIFADNLVPHVLRCEGALVYEAALAARIDEEKLIEAGSEQEVEIRSCGVHAVERLVALLGERGTPTTAHHLDHVLWDRGQEPRYKARPRHRARSVFY
jgi:hypothetical protein